MKLLTGAGTGLVNLLLFPASTSSSSLSQFGCASHSKRGSLISGVCISTLYTCVYMRETDTAKRLADRCVFAYESTCVYVLCSA